MDEIGQKLREARLEKGYTIDDLQQITKIQKRYLIAIEEGNFSALPGDFYVRAFVKQYAGVVGLNPETLFEEYQQDIPVAKPVETNSQAEENTTRTAQKVKLPRRNWGRYLPQVIIMVIAVVIIGVIYALTISQQRSDNKSSIPVQSSVSVDSSSKKADAKSASSKKAGTTASSKKAAASSSKKADAKKLTVSAPGGTATAQTFTVKNLATDSNKITVAATTTEAWVSVTVGSTAWNGTLAAGSTHDIDVPADTTSIVVRTGNATATTIKINGTNVDLGSGTNMVRTMTFTVE